MKTTERFTLTNQNAKSMDCFDRGMDQKVFVFLQGKTLTYGSQDLEELFQVELDRDYDMIKFHNDANEVFLAAEDHDFIDGVTFDGNTVHLTLFCLRHDEILAEEKLGSVSLKEIASIDDYTLEAVVAVGSKSQPQMTRIQFNNDLKIMEEKGFEGQSVTGGLASS